MVDRNAFSVFIVLFILTTTLSYAQGLDQETRVYIDQAHQKTVARIESKVDTQVNRVEQGLDDKVESFKVELGDELRKAMSSILKSVAIGLSGMIIVTLGVYKIIDIKLNNTRNIRKLETNMKKKEEELQKLIDENKKYRDGLVEYKKNLDTFYGSVQQRSPQPIQQPQPQQPQTFTPQYQPQQQPYMNPAFSQPKKEGFSLKKLWNKKTKRILILVLFLMLVLVAWVYFIQPMFFQQSVELVR